MPLRSLEKMNDSVRSILERTLSRNGIAAIATILAISFAVYLWKEHKQFQRIYGKPDHKPLFAPLTLLGMTFERGMEMNWDQRFTLFKKAPKEVITLKPVLWGDTYLYTNSIEVIRQIAGATKSTAWCKPPWTVVGALYWGNNLFAADDDDWRKYRRVLQPAFNSKTYEMVWKETGRLFNEMVREDKWPTTSGDMVTIQNATKTTERLALYVLLSCGFGLPLSWNQKTDTKDGFSVYEGLKLQVDNLILFAFMPNWILDLPFKKFRYMRYIVDGMRKWFNDSVATKKAEVAEALIDSNGDTTSPTFKVDLFTRLALAGHMGDKFHLEDAEIIGNTWIMAVAGHETTKSTLAAAFCYLAAHKDEQAAVFNEVCDAFTESADGAKTLEFSKYDSLVKTRSAFIEALRMIPAAQMIMRSNREETILRVPSGTDAEGNLVEKTMVIPKDAVMIGDMVGVHYNPRLFPSPEKFQPARWYGSTTDDAFTMFSIGPRTCIGRRFALTEATCYLAHVFRDYEVLPLLEEGETLEGWKERVLLKTECKFTLGIAKAPLIFKRR